jgi:PPOX class probable F420-dependent enzyme
VWFAEQNGKLYVKTRSDSGKYKRIRNNPQVKIAPCDIRGKITGPEFNATARLLPQDHWKPANDAIKQKYWLARLPFWSSKNVIFEIELSS